MLYTIIGKHSSDSNPLVKALELCPNNKSALLLLILKLAEGQKYTQCLTLLMKHGGHLDSEFQEELQDTISQLANGHNYRQEQTLYELIENDSTEHPTLTSTARDRNTEVSSQLSRSYS